METNSSKNKENSFKTFLKWFFGIIILLTAISVLSNGYYLSSFFYFVSAFICIPFTYSLLKKELSSIVKYIIVIVFFIVGVLTVPSINNIENDLKLNNSITSFNGFPVEKLMESKEDKYETHNFRLSQIILNSAKKSVRFPETFEYLSTDNNWYNDSGEHFYINDKNTIIKDKYEGLIETTFQYKAKNRYDITVRKSMLITIKYNGNDFEIIKIEEI
ncbi:hypothetical protein HX001_14235 [Empedobacter brevis]|uniref:Uncharacterized protein n=1 Tax=Empedobacter brevis TaxID=247 RepID=A0AAJ1QGM8_9FLAO|nr:hypothetical protein [Empedobacter brevis]MDM1073644.1 hypothetical protein [Empedobacter brevis]